jgi:hypothetical protein
LIAAEQRCRQRHYRWSRPDQVTSNAAAAGRKLSPETMAGIRSALGSFIDRNGAMVGATSPKQRFAISHEEI